MQPALEAFNLRCTHCTWKRSGIVTREYASTLRIQHEFRYDKHQVEVEQ